MVRHYAEHPGEEVLYAVWMRHTSLPIAVLFVQDPDFKPQIVQNQEYQRPFQERHVQTFEAPATKLPWIVKVLPAEKISGRYEEQRHMEYVDKIGNKVGHLRMTHDHEDNAQPFDYRDNGIHEPSFVLFCGEQ